MTKSELIEKYKKLKEDSIAIQDYDEKMSTNNFKNGDRDRGYEYAIKATHQATQIMWVERVLDDLANLEILTTHDGHKIYDGDNFYWINPETREINGPVIAKKENEPNPKNAKFAVLENAIEYVKNL